MVNKKIILDKERILRYLIRKGSVQNTYKIARELEIERWEVLAILNELAKEGKAKLMHGSVKAITQELSGEEMVKTKSEVEELKDRVEKLEKTIEFTFGRIREAIPSLNRKISKENKSKDSLKSEATIIQEV